MTQAQYLSLLLAAIGVFGFWLELNCKFGLFLHAIYDGPGFVQFVIALMIFLAILAVVGEPTSTALAAMVVLGMVYTDYKVNGPANDLWSTFGLPQGKTT